MLTIAGIPVVVGKTWMAGQSWVAIRENGRVVRYVVTAEVYEILTGERDG